MILNGGADGLDALSDEQIMAELIAGRPEALQALHRRYAALVFHLARRSLEAGAAEEVTQDVFLRVWQKGQGFDPGKGPFRPWLLRIAQRRTLNELRSRGRQPRAGDAELADLAAAEVGPEEQAWAQFRRSAVEKALAELPEEQRRALRLAFFHDLSHEQVARFLELPLGTAKGRIRLALEKLNRPLAALVAVLIAGLGLASWRWARRQSDWNRDERALGMLTGSRMETLRLVPAAGTGPVELGPHANYRAERGGGIVVVTLSHLPAAPAGHRYRLWRLAAGRWQALAEPVPDAQGRGRILLEAPAQPWPEGLRLTLETGPAGSLPGSVVVLVWPGQVFPLP